MGSQPESRLSRAIMDMLRAKGIYCIKIHGGPTMPAGTPDILACIPILIKDYDTGQESIVGTFVGFETKMPEGGDPTPIQLHMHKKISNAHGIVFVPRSLEDVKDALNYLGFTPLVEGGDTLSLDKPSLWHGVKEKPHRSKFRA